jgi:transposase InsO family protein
MPSLSRIALREGVLSIFCTALACTAGSLLSSPWRVGMFAESSFRGKRRPEPDARPVADLIQRDFTADEPNTRYVGDITYLPVGGGTFLYLATVVDLYSRRLVGWSIADHMRTELVVDALQAAAHTRGGHLDGAIFHSDNGAQYCSKEYERACRKLGVTRSRGAVGTSADKTRSSYCSFSVLSRGFDFEAGWPAVCEGSARCDARSSRSGAWSPQRVRIPPR